MTFYLDSADLFLFVVEIIIAFGFLVVFLFSLFMSTDYHKISKGWNFVIVGLFFIFIHAVFDVLDTLKWEKKITRDILDFFDGLFFVFGLLLLALGILRINKHSKTLWGFE